MDELTRERFLPGRLRPVPVGDQQEAIAERRRVLAGRDEDWHGLVAGRRSRQVQVTPSPDHDGRTGRSDTNDRALTIARRYIRT